jgi:hypothetical protein
MEPKQGLNRGQLHPPPSPPTEGFLLFFPFPPFFPSPMCVLGVNVCESVCMCECVCVCECVLVVRWCVWRLGANLHDICSAPRSCPQTFAALTVAQSPGPSAGATECDIEVHTEGGLGGHCGAIEDEVLLEKREAGERSVTGRGPTLFLLCHRKVEKRKEKWVYNLRVPLSLSVAYTVPILRGRLRVLEVSPMVKR